MLNKTKKRILSILLAGTVAAVPAYHMTLLTAEAASTDQSTSDSSTSDSNASQGEKPDGEPPEGGAPDGAPGDGTAPSGDGTAPSGDGALGGDGTAPDGEPPEGGAPDGAPGGDMAGGAPGGGSSSAPTEYTAVNHYTEDTTVEGETLESTGTDENAVWISDGATVGFRNIELKRTSEDSTGGDNSSFY